MGAGRMRPISLADVLRLAGARAEGHPPEAFTGVRPLDEAGPGDLSIYTGAKYKAAFEATKAGAVLVAEGARHARAALLVTPNPSLALARVLQAAYPDEAPRPGIAPGAHVSPDAELSPDAVVYPGVFVASGARVEKGVILHAGVSVGEGCRVGEDSVIFPNVTLYAGTIVGKRARIHAGSVLGSDGFGYVHDGKAHVKVPQVGIVRVEDDVEIGAGVTIDRATLGETRIGAGSKIDNLVQIGHNVVIGRQCVIVAQAGIAGSTRVGDGVVIGGQAGLGGHLRIGGGARIGAKSGITNDVPEGETMTGHPALAHRQWLRLQGMLRRMIRDEKA